MAWVFKIHPYALYDTAQIKIVLILFIYYISDVKTLASWVELDQGCQVLFGACVVDTQTCAGNYTDTMCGGPAQRKCCLPGKTVFTIKFRVLIGT